MRGGRRQADTEGRRREGNMYKMYMHMEGKEKGYLHVHVHVDTQGKERGHHVYYVSSPSHMPHVGGRGDIIYRCRGRES